MGLRSQMTSASKTVSNTFPKTSSTNKRPRSQDSKRSLNVSPVQKAAKVKGSMEQSGAGAMPEIPHFLLQTSDGM